VIRCKFKRYTDVTKKVKKIQKCYKKLLKKKINAVLLVQKFYRSFMLKKKAKGEDFEVESEKKENSKLADELFEVGNIEREKRKSMRIMSLSKLDIQTSEHKQTKKEPEMNNDQVLEELMNMENKNFFDESMGSMPVDKAIKKPKKRAKGEKKIEDKLIEQGEALKKRKNELKLQKVKEEEEELIFKPKTHFSSNKNGLKFNQTDFLKRMSYYKNKHEVKLEEMKGKKINSFIGDFTFKPKLSEIAKRVGKRTVDDLLNWRNRKDEHLMKKRQDKQDEEDRKIEDECSKKYRINLASEIILQQKMDRLSKNENIEENEIELWPVQMQKVYFEKK